MPVGVEIALEDIGDGILFLSGPGGVTATCVDARDLWHDLPEIVACDGDAPTGEHRASIRTLPGPKYLVSTVGAPTAPVLCKTPHELHAALLKITDTKPTDGALAVYAGPCNTFEEPEEAEIIDVEIEPASSEPTEFVVRDEYDENETDYEPQPRPSLWGGIVGVAADMVGETYGQNAGHLTGAVLRKTGQVAHDQIERRKKKPKKPPPARHGNVRYGPRKLHYQRRGPHEFFFGVKKRRQ